MSLNGGAAGRRGGGVRVSVEVLVAALVAAAKFCRGRPLGVLLGSFVVDVSVHTLVTEMHQPAILPR